MTTELRPWGHYTVLHTIGTTVKVKELVVHPHSSLSMQRHADRGEIWFIAEGNPSLYHIDDKTTDVELSGHYKQYQTLFISNNEWHQLANETDEIVRIVEIQYGERCVEEDIERKKDV